MDSVGGGSSRKFAWSIFCGGGVVADISRHLPQRARFGGGGGGVVANKFTLTSVADPKFLLFKHLLCFARINIDKLPELGGGGNCPPAPPVPYAYGCTRPPGINETDKPMSE